MKKLLLLSAIALSIATWGSTSIAQPRESKTTMTSTASYAAQSSEAQRIVDWLVSHDAPAKNGSLVNYATKGTFSVRMETSRTSVTQQSVGDAPPVPLPTDGHNGDIFDITHSTGGITETWTYTWQGGFNGGWVLTDYEYHHNPANERTVSIG
jgi:hypothetical protein